MHLAKYKMMLRTDCAEIYKTNDYHRKRLKILENEKYIRRVNRFYIKLDDKGTKLVKDFGYNYSFLCRKPSYIDRITEIAKISRLAINSDIEFIASWDMKDNAIFTQTSRKYIGKLIYPKKEFIVYYISKKRQFSYIGQIINDISKLSTNKNIIIFVEDMKLLTQKQRFVFGNKSTLLITPTIKNIDLLKKVEQLDFYTMLQNYLQKDILLSNWRKADYMTDNKEYILIMPFIDTEKLQKVNVFYKNNPNISRKKYIATLKENIEKIKEILVRNTNIIEVDNWLGGIDEEI